MNRRLHILHLEDEPDFAELVQSLLAQDGLDAQIKRVDNRADFAAALADEMFDAILSDFRLPSFCGLDALGIVREKFPHTPFILVSGAIGERAAIESLKAGATDYVLKQNPDRLPSAIRRAVQEAEERAQRHAAQAELNRRENYFRALTENSLDVLSILNREGVFTYVSPSVERVLGHAPVELTGQNAFARVHPDDLPPTMEVFQAILDGRQRTAKMEFRFQHKEGDWRHLEMFAQHRLDDADVDGIIAHSRDVTDRRRIEEELRRSEKQYRLLFHENPNPMWVFDLENLKFLEVNEAAIQHYGFSREEFLAMAITDVRPQSGHGHAPSTILEVAGQGRIWRHRRKDGGLMDVEVTWSPMVFRGRFAALTMAADVTERRRSEHQNAVFSKLGHRLSSATTASEAAMIICEASDNLFHWDDFSLDLYSDEKNEIYSLLNITTMNGQRVEIPLSPDPKPANALMHRALTKGAELVSGGVTGENGSSGKNSSSGMLVPVRKGERVIGLLFVQSQMTGAYTERDLASLQALADQCGGALERVHAEEALHESEQRSRALFENSPDAIFVEGFDGTVLDVNLAACVLHGLTREQLIGKNALHDLVPPLRRPQARLDFEKLVSGKSSRIEGESLTADNRATPVEVRASRIDYRGQPALLMHVRDITERRAAEAALQSSETLFRSVWENSVDGMRLTDENGVIVAVNDAFCKLVGLAQEDLEGKPYTVIYADSDVQNNKIEPHYQIFQQRISERKAEYQVALHDGRPVILEIAGSLVELHGRPLLALDLFRDVTAQRRLEEQLRQSQKMEAIGQLAGGVAHDFNNILTVIQGHASLLTMADLDDMPAKSAHQIVQAAERAAGLTRQLLTFSRRQLIQPKRLDMNKIIGNMTDMLGRILGEDVTLRLDYSEPVAVVEADAGMMEQVLLNLVVNARDAMPKGGRLTVRVAAVEVTETHHFRQAEARTGQFVCISVMDTGCGISPENLRRIFEPFFTTKEIGRGTGLGLATVYGIVKQHQGWIELESQVGKGTAFYLYLPRVELESAATEKPAAKIAVRGGAETILLVEDEALVRELVARVLQKYGYRVLSAGTGDEALEIWRRHSGKIDLLLTDLVMPGDINGRELAEKLRSEASGLKVIFSSGYSADIVGKDFKIEADLNFLQKPYHPQTLALAVRKCLDAKAE